MAAPIDEHDTTQFLVDALATITKERSILLDAIDRNDIETVIKSSTAIASLLRSSDLSPKDYYEVWMKVSESLMNVEAYFSECVKNNRYPEDLYESAQYIPHIIPRLYLMIITGSICIKTKTFPCKVVLYDLIDMCKGVQHPTRGLFLRNYFVTMIKDKLPDTGSEYEGEGGDINDCIGILLRNFTEMNRLWLRMQHGSARKRPQREQERRDLRVLVGGNILALSQLDGIDATLYREKVIPGLLKEIISCGDSIAQQYFLDCIIHAFPDDFHLVTLDLLLDALPKVNEDIDISILLNDLLKRLVAFAQSKQEAVDASKEKGVSSGEIFESLGSFLSSCLSYRKSLSLASVIDMCNYILNFILLYYGTDHEYINTILSWINNAFSSNSITVLDSEAGSKIVQLLTYPMSILKLEVLKLEQLPFLMNYLPLANRKDVSNIFLTSLLSSDNISIESEKDFEIIDSLYTFIKSLLIDNEGEQNTVLYNEQIAVAKLTYKFSCDGQLLYETIKYIYEHIKQGGIDRVYITIPPLISRLYTILYSLEEHPIEGVTSEIIFKYIYSLLTNLSLSAPSIALKLYLETAFIADSYENNNMCYELLTQACIIYEENPVSRAQMTWLPLLISTLYKCQHIDSDSFKSLCMRVDQYCNSILKKEDKIQFLSMSLCLLFKENIDNEGINKYVSKCLKISDMCLQSQEKLTIQLNILDAYFYINSQNTSIISKEQIDSLISSIEEESKNCHDFDAQIEKCKALLNTN